MHGDAGQTPSGVDEERAAREREFHDNRFSDTEKRSASRFYAITGSSGERFREHFNALQPGQRVLELGCGDHAEAWSLSARGVDVTAIDISQVAIDEAIERADREGRDNLSFSMMNAEAMTFDDSVFDAVIGLGILHHLDLDRAMPQIARVLRPDGWAAFYEPMGHNKLIDLYRRFTPDQRTPDEHPLLMADLKAMSRWFDDVEYEQFHLLSLTALAAIKSRHFDDALARLERLDRRLITRVPALGRYAWMTVLHLAQPRPAGA